MSKSYDEFLKRIAEHSHSFTELDGGETAVSGNHKKRLLFSKLELLKLDVDESDQLTDEDKHKLLKTLSNLTSDKRLNLKCKPLPSKWAVLQFLDQIIRGVSAISFLIVSATCLALPGILIKPIDDFLVSIAIIHPLYKISTNIKRFIGYITLRLAGISIKIESYKPEHFGYESVLGCFSHASSIDAFLLGEVIPVHHFTLSKRELFFIPFFSWLLRSFGGIPVDRKNRDRAINALRLASEYASKSRSGDSIFISPEGTRSTNGQLQPFKKGAFYIWDDLQATIIPIMIFGAFELCPPRMQMSSKGRAYVRFLKPIHKNEASSREEMSKVLRKRMLLSQLECPVDAG